MVATGKGLLLLLAYSAAAVPSFEHNAIDLERRQEPEPAMPVMADAITTPSVPLVYTYITPSPGASPVPVTQQRQSVTSYVAQYTICVLPPAAYYPVPTPTPWPTTRPFRNATASFATGQGRCTTIYSETVTEVCATTLYDLTRAYPITSCTQNITFSTEFGYLLTSVTPTGPATITPTPTASVRVLTTFYIASWQALTAVQEPTDVDLQICFFQSDGAYVCEDQVQRWLPTTATSEAVRTTSINMTTTMAGPSQLVFETITANFTDATPGEVSMVETAELRYNVRFVSTVTETRERVVTQTAPTSEVTYTVIPSPSPPRTVTISQTSIIYAGTTTLRSRRPEATPPPDDADS